MMGRRKRPVLLVPGARTEPTPLAGGGGDALAPFDPAERGEWWWRQPRWSKRAWTLEAGGRTVGLARAEGFFSGTTRVRFAGGVFEVRRGWTGNFEARAEGGQDALARHVGRWSGGGRIELPGGDDLEMVTTGFFGGAREIRTADRLVLLRFESHEGFLRHHVRIVPADAARARRDLELLLALASAVVFAPKRHHHAH